MQEDVLRFDVSVAYGTSMKVCYCR